MSNKIILGDWGTSSCRLYLYDLQRGESLDMVVLPGIKFVESIQEAFLKATKPWLNTHNVRDAVLCGMVGSNIGWVNAGYAQCPATFTELDDLLKPIQTPDCDIKIIPGVQTSRNIIGLPDVMRGEETQIIGWARTTSRQGFVCLPGTHTKWATVMSDSISNFSTSVNGELFDVIRKHSVLVGATDTKPTIGDEYRRGLDVAASGAPLTQTLMSVRANQIIGTYDAVQSQSYLLGLLIGSDVLASLPQAEGVPITVIGGEAPAQFYASAIQYFGGQADIFDGQAASLAGLKHFAERVISA